MTRKEVAARLGRSLATVRRLEGSQLHPVVDASGVHRFDPGEVETLARDTAKPGGFGSFAHPEMTSRELNGDDGCIACSRLRNRLKRLEAELDDVQQAHARQMEDLQASHRQAVAQSTTEQYEIESALSDLLEALED